MPAHLPARSTLPTQLLAYSGARSGARPELARANVVGISKKERMSDFCDFLLACKAFVDAMLGPVQRALDAETKRIRAALTAAFPQRWRVTPESQRPPVKHRHGPRSWSKRARR